MAGEIERKSTIDGQVSAILSQAGAAEDSALRAPVVAQYACKSCEIPLAACSMVLKRAEDGLVVCWRSWAVARRGCQRRGTVFYLSRHRS